MQAEKIKPWTDKHINRYIWLFNYLKQTKPQINYDNYIDDNKNILMDIIEKNDKWHDGSKEQILFMVGRYLELKHDTDSEIFKNKGYYYMLKIKEKEADNIMDAKEAENYKDKQYYINIIKSINYNNINTIKEHLKFLLLNLLIYQPPLRTSFYLTAKFIFKESDNDMLNNFILILPDEIYYIINKDKASNYKSYKGNVNLSKIKINDSNLKLLIRDSVQQYPRTYLFEVNKNVISDSTIVRYLREITQNKGVTFNNIRMMYISTLYNTKGTTIKQKKALAGQMRHSTNIAELNYHKIPSTQTKKELNDIILTLRETITELNNKQTITPEIKDNDKLFKKRRADIIYRLNKGTAPRENTIEKYNIIYNNDNKNYS